MQHLKYLNSVYISMKEFVIRLLTYFLKITYFACCMRPGGKFGKKMAKKFKKMPKKCEIWKFGPRKSKKKGYIG